MDGLVDYCDFMLRGINLSCLFIMDVGAGAANTASWLAKKISSRKPYEKCLAQVAIYKIVHKIFWRRGWDLNPRGPRGPQAIWLIS